MFLYALIVLALALTCTMFAKREMLLGFPSVIFWAILGGHCYTESAVTWDIYYFIFFAAVFMAIFCALAMYALREKHDTPTEQELEEEGWGEGEYIDETKEPVVDDDVETPWGSNRTEALRKRAEQRRAVARGKPVRKRTT